MSEGPSNPYAPTSSTFGTELPVPMDNATRAKLDAIIKDANQFWIAILLCIFCSGIGSLIIGIWYCVRLVQWNAMARTHPLLMAANSPPTSIAGTFQRAKVKLILGLVFGAVMLALLFAYIGLLFIASASKISM